MSAEKKQDDSDGLARSSFQLEAGETKTQPDVANDAVFGEMAEDGPNYRDVGFIATSILMMKCQIGLGVLSLPRAFNQLGLIPGVICLLAVCSVITWGSYMIGRFKLNHREIYGIDDAMGVVFGPVGRAVLAVGFILFLVFCAGSGLLSVSIGLNAVSTHGTCTAVFVAVACVVVIMLASIRTLARLWYLAWIGLTSILVSILVLVIAVAIQDRPDAAPTQGPWTADWNLVGNPSFTEGVNSISTFIFAYAGTPFFFPIAAEMRDPRHYTRSLLLCQLVTSVAYLVIGIVVYYYCGSFVTSPALGSAGSLMKKVSYGIALPGLFVSATMATHLASKHIFVHILRGSRHLSSNTPTHWLTWLASVTSVSITAYCIASGIPNFEGLVSLVGALLGTLMCFQPLSCMWFYENWNRNQRQGQGWDRKTLKWMLLVVWNGGVIAVGTFLMVAGTYGAAVGVVQANREEGAGAWSCADNSHST